LCGDGEGEGECQEEFGGRGHGRSLYRGVEYVRRFWVLGCRG